MRDIVITSSVLILAILAIRYLAKGKINPRLQYALWLLVVFRLVIPVSLFHSPVSVLNLLPAASLDELQGQSGSSRDFGTDFGETQTENSQAENDTKENTENQSMENLPVEINSIENDQTGNQRITAVPDGKEAAAELSAQNKEQPDKGQILLGIWLAGIVIVGSYMLFHQMKWKQYLYQNRKPLESKRNYQGIPVYTLEGLPSPCLSGRCIYLTQEMAADEKQLMHILAHEYCHKKQWDSLWVVVRCVLAAVYWFHPLVWAAAYVSKQDSELACDMAAVRLLGEEERFAYGRTLLQLAAKENHDRTGIGLASTMNSGGKGIRERISRLAGKPRYLTAAAGIVAVIAVLLGIVTFSGADRIKEETEENETIVEAGESSLEAEQREKQFQEAEQAEELRLEAEQTERLRQEAEQREKQFREAEQTEELRLEAEQTERMRQEAEQRERLLQETEQTAVLTSTGSGKTSAASEALLARMASYDKMLAAGGIGVRIPSDYMQAYAKQGEAALEEGMYLLVRRKGGDNTTISIYGMYTKQYGCEGIKIVVGDEVSGFDEPWTLTGTHGLEENLRVYGEKAQGDGSIRTFAWKTPMLNTDASEIWSFYLCDRDEKGAIEMYSYSPEDYVSQMQERLSFRVMQEEKKVYVYDRGQIIGAIDFSVMEASVPEGSEIPVVEKVVLDGSMVNWDLGYQEDEIRLITAIGLKLENGQVWYQGLNLISFPVSCTSSGERSFRLGQAQIEVNSVNGMK